MRILITNDDGINAPGLEALADIAAEVAGPDGEVWTVAPAFEQSGVAHCISYVHPTLIAEMGPRRFAAEGTPADCVLAAIADVMKDTPPDLVLSGVNRGNNSGENVMYSGTIGGAMEAALQGLPAIALSQYMGQRTAGLEDPFQAARVHGPRLIRQLLEHGDWTSDEDFRLFYNINFPPCDAASVKGVRVAPQGRRRGRSKRPAPTRTTPWCWPTSTTRCSTARTSPTLPALSAMGWMPAATSIAPAR